MNMLSATWLDAGAVDDIPIRGARVVKTAAGDIALFRAADGEVFALRDLCPHKGGPLSQGIIHGHAVTCPLHNWVISLVNGKAQGADVGCTPKLSLRIVSGRIQLSGEAIIQLMAEEHE